MNYYILFLHHQFSSVAQFCPTFCDPLNYSTPGLPVQHQIPELSQTHVHWFSEAIQPPHPLSPLLLLPSIFPASGSFPVSQLFALGDQSIRASAPASVLPMNIQGWLPLESTDLISLQSKELSRVFSSTTVWKHQFLNAQPSFVPNCGSVVKNLLAMQETWVQSLSWEDLLEKGMATHSSILAWRIP